MAQKVHMLLPTEQGGAGDAGSRTGRLALGMSPMERPTTHDRGHRAAPEVGPIGVYAGRLSPLDHVGTKRPTAQSKLLDVPRLSQAAVGNWSAPTCAR
jgi:hypothetical protein